ncbi:MAG: ATP-binding protein [Pseudobdellovibrionaceae bacterium]
MVNRILSQNIENTNKSIVLLGPRQTGKSTLVQNLRPDLEINLANQDTFLEFISNPKALVTWLESAEAKNVFIDEVQRIPSLLNTVQFIIDQKKGHRFYLTGSSARKLKKGRANLLPGRVFDYQLGPFIAAEFEYKMGTEKLLKFGSLPEVYLSEKATFSKRLLSSYTGLYLKEEIQAEALTRNLESFSRFLKAILTQVAQFIDYSKLAKVAKVSRQSTTRYFEVLEDTLVGYRIFPMSDCLETADLIKHPKFYFFDPGIYNGMIANFEASEDRRGALAEQLVFSQLFHSAKAFDKSFEINTFRTRGGVEIDFIFKLENQVFPIEVKSTDHIGSEDIKSLKMFSSYYKKKYTPYLFHMGLAVKKIDGIWCLPWQQGMKEIGL